MTLVDFISTFEGSDSIFEKDGSEASEILSVFKTNGESNGSLFIEQSIVSLDCGGKITFWKFSFELVDFNLTSEGSNSIFVKNEWEASEILSVLQITGKSNELLVIVLLDCIVKIIFSCKLSWRLLDSSL